MLLAALITFGLAVCVTAMLGLGAAMVYKGFLRGILIDRHPHCDRCGYDMVGHQRRPVRCPECGSDLRVPGMVCIGARRPHKRRIGLGLALIALNVGGLIGCWKLGEVQPTSSSSAAAPGLRPVRGMVTFATTIDRLADLDSGPVEQTVPELSSFDSNDAACRSTRDELILAFYLYCRIPFQKTKASTPEVQELAALLQRSPASIARKLGNFGAFDPELKRRRISGLPGPRRSTDPRYPTRHPPRKQRGARRTRVFTGSDRIS